MSRLTIVQVGDVHYPEHGGPAADVKDESLDAALLGEVTAPVLQGSMRRLLKVLAESPSALIAFTGDLTSRGDIDEYKRCVEYLNEALLLTDPSKWTDDQLQVVPGNHDVDRNHPSIGSGDIYAKFGPLKDVWVNSGRDVISTSDVRSSTITLGASEIRAFGLNSCIGCGEKRRLPDALREDLRTALAAAGVDVAVASPVLDDVVSRSAETIDAPAYAEEHVSAICDAIQGMPPNAVPVVIAHHNLLQQAQPRFDLYTDVMNAGMVRTRLGSLGMPILYLHGHIHSDPIEHVSQAAPGEGQVVCVSAPEFKEGFNVIELAFTSGGAPIGCVVHRHRVRLNGMPVVEGVNRIRFSAYDAAITPLASAVAIALLEAPQCGSLHEMRNALTGASATYATVGDREVADAVEEVEWLGLVEVLNREKPLRDWRLRAVAHNG